MEIKHHGICALLINEFHFHCVGQEELQWMISRVLTNSFLRPMKIESRGHVFAHESGINKV